MGSEPTDESLRRAGDWIRHRLHMRLMPELHRSLASMLDEADRRGYDRGVREGEPSALADDYWMPLSIREALRLVSEECPEHAETLRDWIVRGNAAKRTAYEHGVLDERERAVGVCRRLALEHTGPASCSTVEAKWHDGFCCAADECADAIATPGTDDTEGGDGGS